ncbi:MAG: response regulator [Candidatus Protistobacter heckmanni]|nr:response regulator [Candidatus Protistobacter heckmanni]
MALDDDAYKISVAEDGLVALDYFLCRGKFANRPAPNSLLDLVLLDMRMPHLGGIEVLKELRREPSTRYVLVG